jgi:dTMP kinase
MARGLFFVFCGGEGCGKTTQAKLFYNYLRRIGKAAILTKEPGGDDGVGRDIRKILLNPDYKDRVDDMAELLLFEANRAQHTEKVIKPALERGEIVVCDRFNADTYAYQVSARKAVSGRNFLSLDKLATRGLQPDFYFYIDIDPEIGLARKKKERVLTRFEKENLDFHRRVREGFLEFFEKFVDKNRWRLFTGESSSKTIHRQILEVVKIGK